MSMRTSLHKSEKVWTRVDTKVLLVFSGLRTGGAHECANNGAA